MKLLMLCTMTDTKASRLVLGALVGALALSCLASASAAFANVAAVANGGKSSVYAMGVHPAGGQHLLVATKKKKKKSKVSLSRQQALGAARDYLKYQHFSRQGLIDQLSSPYGDQFSKADAAWAVDQLKVNWNQQAVGAARDYLKYQHFSRQGLIDQLSSAAGEKFTIAQATYAVNRLGL